MGGRVSAEYAHAYYLKHKDKHRAYSRAWYLKNRDRILEQEATRSRLKLYGVTEGRYNEMLTLQEGFCAICKKPEKNGRRLGVDHCHATGKVRGLLCASCNVFLGRIETNDLGSYISYLEKYSNQSPCNPARQESR